MYTAMRLLFAAFVGVMFGSLFWKIGEYRNTQQNFLNAMGSMYSAVLFLGIQNSSGVQPVVFVKRTVFYRERAAGIYSALPSAFVRVAIELPYTFFQTIFNGVIICAMMGFEWTGLRRKDIFLYAIVRLCHFPLCHFPLYWSEEKKQEWLLSELRGKHPLFGHDLPKTEEIADVLDTFHAISELRLDSFGVYIISMANAPSDVLLVRYIFPWLHATMLYYHCTCLSK